MSPDLWTVRVIKHPEDDLRDRVGGGRVVRGRHHLREVVLQGLAQHRVEGQVRADDVLLDPHVRAQALYLLPQAVQVLKKEKDVVLIIRSLPHLIRTISLSLSHLFLRVRRVRPEYPERRVVRLDPALDVPLQRAQHAVQLGLLLLVELPPHPGEGGQDGVGEPVASHLRNPLLQGGVHEVVHQLEERAGGDDVAVDQVGDEAEGVAGRFPAAALQALLHGLHQHVHALGGERERWTGTVNEWRCIASRSG